MNVWMMEGIRLRAAVEGDAAWIARVHVESWRDAYASILDPAFLAGPIDADLLARWVDRLQRPSPAQIVQVVETRDGRIVGFACADCDVDRQWGSRVDNLHVIPSLRGQGIGERLLRSLMSLSADRSGAVGLHLWVFEENRAALRFYERLSGEVVGRDVSRIAAAGGRTILRVHWPAPDAVS